MTSAASASPHRLHYVARTDTGLLRATNQDSVFAGERLLVVADGMGGHAAGDTASRLVVDAFAPLNERPPGPDLLRELLTAIRTGNAAIADMVDQHPELDGMGTTVTAMLIEGTRAAFAHVGDSRAYLYREGVLHQLTHDDTFVQSLVDDGRITERQAHEHPQRNLLLRALTGLTLDPMVIEREIKVGDRYLLCSDGLSGVVDPESIADALAHPDPEVAADTLIQLALVAGGPDNVTTIVADVLATGAESDDEIRAAAASNDPASTSPIARLTREMPRVPLPPIPEEPGAMAEILATDDEDGDESEEEFGEPDDDEDAGDADDGDAYDGDAYDGPAGSSDGASTAADAEPAAGDDASGPETAASGAGAAAAASDSTTENPAAAGRTATARTAAARTGKARGHGDGTTAPGRHRHWYRRGAAVVAAAVLLAALITASTIWVRHQYYVSEQGNVVVVFRGVDGSLLGWGFSTFEETSCAGATDCTPMKVSDLQPAARNQVRAGIKATSLKDARTVVARLSAQLLPPCPTPGDGDADDDEAAPTSAPSSGPTATGTSAGEGPVIPDNGTTAPTTATAPKTTATTRTPPTGATAAGALAIPRTVGAPLATAAAETRDVARTTGTPAAPIAFAATETPAAGASGTAEGAAAAAAAAPLAAPIESPTPDTTVTATPLAPATLTPGVTCRTVP